MTLKRRLDAARRALAATDIPDAHLEAEILWRHVLGYDRATLYACLGEDATMEQGTRFRDLLARRLNREPAAYIVGHREFYGLDFEVDSRVLIPRPETELLVSEAISRCAEMTAPAIVDVGTGSGAVAVSLARYLPRANVFAADVSAPALAVANHNCRRHGVAARVTLLQCDLLSGLPGPVDLILANLPYLTAAEMASLPPEVRDYEPLTALSGGGDGLEVVRRLMGGFSDFLKPGGGLMLEVGPAQVAVVAQTLRWDHPEARLEILTDLAGRKRVVRLEF